MNTVCHSMLISSLGLVVNQSGTIYLVGFAAQEFSAPVFLTCSVQDRLD